MNTLQQLKTSQWSFHLMAILVIVVWGASFPCTKLLLANGLTPTGIFVYRSAIAYLGLLVFSRLKVFKHEGTPKFSPKSLEIARM